MNTIKKTVVAYIIAQDNDSENPRDWGDNLGTMHTWHRNYVLGGAQDENNQTYLESYEQWLWDNWPNEIKAAIPDLEGYYIEDGEVFKEATQEEKDAYHAARNDPDESEEALELYSALCERFESEATTDEQQAFFNAQLAKWAEDNVATLNLYLYDHSGITINTSGFSCPWDSGQVGFIYTTKARAEELGAPWDTVERQLKGEVKDLDKWFTGDVHGYKAFKMPDDWKPEDADIDADVLLDTEYSTAYLIEEKDESELEDADGEETDSCWGFIGMDYLKEELKSMAEYRAEQAEKDYKKAQEQRRRQYFCM